MAQITRDDPWHYNAVEDVYIHMVSGERLTPSQWQSQKNVGGAWTSPPPPLPPQTVASVAMVKLPDVLAALIDIGVEHYETDENVKRYAAHVAERVRGLVNVRDPKELLR